jgi:hypothetical protein
MLSSKPYVEVGEEGHGQLEENQMLTGVILFAVLHEQVRSLPTSMIIIVSTDASMIIIVSTGFILKTDLP